MKPSWLEVTLGVVAALLLAVALLVLGFCSTAFADIQIDSSGRTLGSPLLRSYLPNGTAHLQGLVLCDKSTPERCISVNADGSINVTVAVSSVTVTSSVLPTGAATSARQAAPGAAGSASSEVVSVQGIAGMTPVAVSVTGTAAVSVASSALPTGAATSVKQPNFGNAGSPSADVITVQGIAGGIAQPVNISSALPAGTNVIGHIICDSGCSGSGGTASNFGSAFPAAGTAIGFSDGTNMVAGRIRAATPAAGDNGIVVRPLMMTDGVNTMPAGDSSARSIHVTVDNGSTTATENSTLNLGNSSVAETIAVVYGGVVTTPSTMTLGTNGTGMRATLAAAGQQIMQLNAPRGDWRVGKANATGTADTSLIAALGSGVRFCMTDWAATNDSATDSSFRFRDGTTDLTERIMVPTKGGNNKALITPICGTANTAFQFAADTGVTTLRVTVGGYISKE